MRAITAFSVNGYSGQHCAPDTWNLDIWRYEAWHQPHGSVFDFGDVLGIRDSAADMVRAAAASEISRAVAILFRRSVAQSIWSLAAQAPMLRRKAGRCSRTAGMNTTFVTASVPGISFR